MFSPAMMAKALAGEKTETRRVVIPQPGDILVAKTRKEMLRTCRYGQPGSLLWIRERARVVVINTEQGPGGIRVNAVRLRYESDGKRSGWVAYPARLKWHPIEGRCLPYGGHREASRASIVLERVTIERLSNITTYGIRREGVTGGRGCFERWDKLWDSINRKRGYGCKVNPWVWVLRFRLASPRAHRAALRALCTRTYRM